MAATLDTQRLTNLRQKIQQGQINEQILQGIGEFVEAHIQEHWSANSPSFPGNPPAVVTGNLKRSVGINRISAEHYRVEATAEYAIYLEFGTSRMTPRPFMTPAAEAALENLLKLSKSITLEVIYSA